MTEAEWLACTEPVPMLQFLLDKASDRKLRLFAAACCRRVSRMEKEQSQMENDKADQLVDLAERYAEGEATDADLDGIPYPVFEEETYYLNAAIVTASPSVNFELLFWTIAEVVKWAAFIQKIRTDFGDYATFHKAEEETRRRGYLDASAAREAATVEERARQADILRHLFGNPFRPAQLQPAWLTSTVRQIAMGIYQKRTFERLPILADALEEAGCTDADILSHCRDPGEHMRGCWVVDALLEKS